MKIKTTPQFEVFRDGTVDIHNVAGNKLSEKVETLCFGDQIIGVQRHYAARSVNVEINRLIGVPKRDYLSTRQNAVIGSTRYKIEQVQQITDSYPPKTVLTLRQLGISEVV